MLRCYDCHVRNHLCYLSGYSYHRSLSIKRTTLASFTKKPRNPSWSNTCHVHIAKHALWRRSLQSPSLCRPCPILSAIASLNCSPHLQSATVSHPKLSSCCAIQHALLRLEQMRTPVRMYPGTDHNTSHCSHHRQCRLRLSHCSTFESTCLSPATCTTL